MPRRSGGITSTPPGFTSRDPWISCCGELQHGSCRAALFGTFCFPKASGGCSQRLLAAGPEWRSVSLQPPSRFPGRTNTLALCRRAMSTRFVQGQVPEMCLLDCFPSVRESECGRRGWEMLHRRLLTIFPSQLAQSNPGVMPFVPQSRTLQE